VWPHCLEEDLRAKGKKVEVINLGVSAFNSQDELESLNSLGWDFKPDIVVLQYLVNDVLPKIPLGTGHGGLRDDVLPLAIKWSWHLKLIDALYIYSFLNEQWQKFAVRLLHRKDLSYIDLHADGTETWENTQKALLQMAMECRQRNIHFLMVMFPLIHRGVYLDQNFEYSGLHGKLGRFSSMNGIPFLDLLPVLSRINSSPEPWRVVPWDAHPSILYHGTAAEAIADKLTEMKWIQ
jgi:hypothetical protein